jgi:DNA-binding protein WhiA
MEVFEIVPGITTRKGRYVVYLKDSSRIIDLLNVIGAHQSLMQMENIRILKEMRNSANRQFNCDSANISKMVRAAGKQVEDIQRIRESDRWERLSPALKETALARLENPDISIQELGTMLDPPLGKSGVNHRLRKLSQIAQELRLHRD